MTYSGTKDVSTDSNRSGGIWISYSSGTLSDITDFLVDEDINIDGIKGFIHDGTNFALLIHK